MTARTRLALAGASMVLVGLATLSPFSARAQPATQPKLNLGSRWAFVADISRPTNETEGFDEGTAELLVKLDPDGICVPGDVQYENGNRAMFESTVGFAGTYGRLVGDRLKCPAMGNHDVADPGPNAPGFSSFFASVLTGLPCEDDPIPCKPLEGYYGLDLDANRDGTADWYIIVINSNCQQAGGGTGDTQTPSCANDSPMVNWMRAYTAARHGGAHSGRKCSIVVDHHERWGTLFFADNPALNYPWQVGNHFHWDVWESGHSHSTARMGAMTWDGHLSPTGSGQRQITSGAGGRSLSPVRLITPREGTRYRDNTRYGVELLTLTVTQDPAGWQGGAWSHVFYYSDGTTADAASAGCWP